MKRLLLAVMLVLVLPGVGWGDVYYVIPDIYNTGMPPSPVGSGVTYILAKSGSWPTSKSDCISGVSCIERLFDTTGVAYDQIILSGGASGVTYHSTALDTDDSTLNMSAADPDSIIMRGAESSTEGYSHSGPVVLTSGADATAVVNMNNPGARVSHIKILQPGAANALILNTSCGTQCSAEDIEIWHPTGTYNSAGHGVNITGNSSGVSRVKVINSPGANFVLGGVGNNDAPFVHSSSGVSAGTYNVWVFDTSGASVWNNTFSGAASYNALFTGLAASAPTSVANNYFGVPAANYPSAPYTVDSVYTSSATTRVSFWNNHIVGSAGGVDVGKTQNSVGLQSGTSQTGLPTFKTSRRKGIICPSVDDSTNGLYMSGLTTIAESYGHKITWFVTASTFAASDSAQNYARDMIARGHEVGWHGNTHTDLSHLAQFAINYTGGAGAKFSVNAGASTFTLDGPPAGAGGDDFTIDMTGKTVAEVCNEIDTKANWQAGVTYFYGANAFVGQTISGNLADVTDVACSGVSVTVSVDPVRFYGYEITQAKASIEAALLAKGVAYTVTSGAYPFGNYNASVIDAMVTYGSGILGVRNIARTGVLGFAGITENLSVYEVDGTNPSTMFDGNTTSGITREAMDAYLEWSQWKGGIWVPYFHNWGEVDQATWTIIFEEIAKAPGISVMSFSDALKHVRGTSTGLLPTGSTSDNKVWTRSWGATDSAWTPIPYNTDSVLRRTGTNDRNSDGTNETITDILGTTIGTDDLQDIGAYEYHYQLWAINSKRGHD